MIGKREEVFLPFPAERSTIALATEFRSTWLISSMRSLKERGLFEHYMKELPPDLHETMTSLVAGVWIPVKIAVAHYEACDRLGTSYVDQLNLGREASTRAQATVFSTMLRLTKQAGVTPWTVLAQVQRLWDRMFKGGGVGAWKLGPKEARVEFVGCPIAKVPYFRVGLQGVLLGVGEMFCQKLYLQEIPSLCTRSTLGFRGSWV